MNKVLVRLYVPIIEKQYDVWIPLNKRVYKVINLLIKAIEDFSGGHYKPSKMPMLYDKLTAKHYEMDLKIKETDIRNGTELILI